MEREEKIDGGAFLVARKLFDSELWLGKPSGWKVIWIYILGKVNHKNNKRLKRGEGYFNFSQEHKFIGIDITTDKIKSFLQWARVTSMVDTMRTTRGMIIKVNKYDPYQKLDNYVTTAITTSKPQENHERTTMINKNDKNDKNEKNLDTNVSSELNSQVKQVMNIFYKINPTLNWGNKTQRKACEDLIKKFGLEETKRMAEMACAIQGQKYAPVATTPYQFKEKLAQFKIYFDKENSNRREVFDDDDIEIS